MKYVYYITIFLVFVTMIVTITAFCLGKTNGYLLPISIVFINGITLIVILLDRVFNFEKLKKDNTQIVTTPTMEQFDNSKKEEDVKDSLSDDNFKWSMAMYKRFAERWQNLYDNVEYPVDKATKAEISVLSWEISSLTMDYLMLINESPNLLERHKESVNSIIENLKYQEMGLKPFYEDPTTVPAKVLAVYNTLCPQLATRQSFVMNIFGYCVEIPKKQ